MIKKAYYMVKEIAVGRDPIGIMGSNDKTTAENFARDMNAVMEKYDLRTHYEVEVKMLREIKVEDIYAK